MFKKLLLLLLVIVTLGIIYQGRSIMLQSNKQFYNLTTPIKEDLVAFPGDPEIKIEKIKEIEEHDHASYSLCAVSGGNHTGTHVDFPAHVIKHGANSSQFPLENLIDQPGVVIEVPNTENAISRSFLEAQKKSFFKGAIVFFKTRNSDIPKTKDHFTEDFVAIKEDAAEILVNAQVKAVGIDYLSVDQYQNEELPVHKKLLENSILIVENLELKDIPAGEYLISIAPNQIEEIDGAPATVYAKPR